MFSPRCAVNSRPVTWVVRRFFAYSRNATELLSQTRVASDPRCDARVVSPDGEHIHEDNEWTTRPWYPEKSDAKRCQARRGVSVNPESTCVVLFPGEAGPGASSISPGDGKRRSFLSLPKSAKGKEMLAAASDVLKTDLEEEFARKSGHISQPAIVVHSLIAAEEMVNRNEPECRIIFPSFTEIFLISAPDRFMRSSSGVWSRRTDRTHLRR